MSSQLSAVVLWDELKERDVTSCARLVIAGYTVAAVVTAAVTSQTEI